MPKSRQTKPIIVRLRDNPLIVYEATRVIGGTIEADDPGTQIFVNTGEWAVWEVNTECRGFVAAYDNDAMCKLFEVAEG